MLSNEYDYFSLKVYRPPKKLRKRHEYSYKDDEKPVEANEDATGVELHKDSKFFASWQNFKDNNPVVNKFVDYRWQYNHTFSFDIYLRPD